MRFRALERNGAGCFVALLRFPLRCNAVVALHCALRNVTLRISCVLLESGLYTAAVIVRRWDVFYVRGIVKSVIISAAAAAAAVTDDSQTLEVLGLRYPADTGAYKCIAVNGAGSAQDIATVFVQQQTSVTGRQAPNVITTRSHMRINEM